MTELLRFSIRELQRSGWEVRVDEDDLVDFVSTHSLHEPAERTLRILHAKTGAIAAEFTVVQGTIYREVALDLVADLKTAEDR